LTAEFKPPYNIDRNGGKMNLNSFRAAVCFAVFFLFLGAAFPALAQDLIVLKDGNMIEAKVIEINPLDIRYKRFTNLEGPDIVIHAADVLSIRYENGTTDIINAASITGKKEESRAFQMDPQTLYVGISADPSGFLLYGPSLLTEFTKNHFNAVFFVSFPSLGMNVKADGFGLGFGVGVNYLWHLRYGAIYLGGLFDYSGYKVFLPGLIRMPDGTYTDGYYDYTSEKPWKGEYTFVFNAGYKYYTSSGVYYNIGGNLGAKMTEDFKKHKTAFGFQARPNISIGYTF
jgi:hypothetical protein